MKKKVYLKPTMVVIEIQRKLQLMVGSGTKIKSVKPTGLGSDPLQMIDGEEEGDLEEAC